MALVIGGSGVVGRAVVSGLAAKQVPTCFTYCANRAVADELAQRTGARAEQLDLRDGDALGALFASLDRDGVAPDVLVHAAAVNPRAGLLELTRDEWQTAVAVNATSALVACQEVGRRATAGADIVLLTALDRTQSLPIPAAFAATQGLITALAMGAARDLGARGVRINVVALGPLGAGISQSLPGAILDDFRTYSALRRAGTAAEAAAPILWLALENTYMNGKVMPVNGGV